MLYSKTVMDHFKNPRNLGQIDDASGVGEVGNPVCGDILRIYLKINNGIITDAKFLSFGCASAIASSSIATELIIGKTIAEVVRLTNQAVTKALDGLPKTKLHCSVLAEEAVQAALADYAQKTGQTIQGLKYAKPTQISKLHNKIKKAQPKRAPNQVTS